jgi:hypothetical protein
LSCGACPAGQPCIVEDGGTAGACAPCVPTTCAELGRTCGTAPDGCGGTLDCGSCPSGLTCAADHACHDLANACTITGDTVDCLLAQDKPGQASCGQCVIQNGCFDPAQQGGTCETVTGTSPHFAGALPDGRTCTAATDAGAAVFDSPTETETQACLQALGTIFSSKCAASLQETPCLCGMTDVSACLTCTATPTGPLYDLYACDIDSTSGCVINMDFTLPSIGVGQANAIVQCAAAFGCNCF